MTACAIPLGVGTLGDGDDVQTDFAGRCCRGFADGDHLRAGEPARLDGCPRHGSCGHDEGVEARPVRRARPAAAARRRCGRPARCGRSSPSPAGRPPAPARTVRRPAAGRGRGREGTQQRGQRHRRGSATRSTLIPAARRTAAVAGPTAATLVPPGQPRRQVEPLLAEQGDRLCGGDDQPVRALGQRGFEFGGG